MTNDMLGNRQGNSHGVGCKRHLKSVAGQQTVKQFLDNPTSLTKLENKL
jgi:hypothetical protein